MATLVKPEDRDERRRRMASMKRAVRKHDIAAKTPERTPKERKPTEARPAKPDAAKPAGRRGPAKPKGKPTRQPNGKKPSREGRG